MTETIRDESVIPSEFIGVNETSVFDLFYRHSKESFPGDILYNFHPDFSSPFQDIEHGDLPGSSPATVSLSHSAEVRFIHLDLPGQNERKITISSDNRLPKQVEEIVNRVTEEIKLMSDFSK